MLLLRDKTSEFLKMADPISSLLGIINSIPFPIVVIYDDHVTQKVLYKNKECRVPNSTLITSYRNDDPLLDERDKVHVLANGDVLWQFSREIQRDIVTFDIIYPCQQREIKIEVTKSILEEDNPRIANSKILTTSINRIRSMNDKLDSLIQTRMESLSPEMRNSILHRRGIASAV